LPFRDDQLHFRDIVESIDNVELFLKDVSYQQYQGDLKTKSVVERQMPIIAEAAYRLSEDARLSCSGPDWKGLIGMGNILRHGYQRIDDRVIWDTAKIDLPLLKAAVSHATTRHAPPIRAPKIT
jgi:uncharacterized protein with HEPN domain